MGGIQLTVHSTGRSHCALNNREAEGVTVTFGDGTVKEKFLSYKALAQLLTLKLGNGNGAPPAPAAPKPAPVPTATAATSGTAK